MMLYARFLLELSSSKDNDYNNEILQALLNSRSNFITTDYIL
jgi:glyceraldehyde-3-phosphate dehydrogenase (NADP+)